MIRDRMPDLLKLADTYPGIYNEPEAHENVPLDPKLVIMFKRVDKVVKFLSQMKEIMRELRKLHDKLLLAASHQQEIECRALIEKLGNRFCSLGRKSKSVLKRFEMNEDIMISFAAGSHVSEEDSNGIEMRQISHHVTWHRLPSGALLPLSSDHYIPAEVRMRFHLHNIFAYDLSCLVREYYVMQKVYGDQCKEKIRRQMAIIGREVEETELDEAMDRGERLPLLHQEIADDTMVSEEMRAKLREVESYRQDIIQIERNIEELHRSFVTISSLVYEQGDIINHIENHIMNSADYVEGGSEMLKKASGFQSKYRKKKCLLAVCVTAVLAILIIIIVLSVKKSHNTKTTKTKIVYYPKKVGKHSVSDYDQIEGTDFEDEWWAV